MSANNYWVCVVTRNGGSTIGKTLDAITEQTILPGLIVVVDDGSTDETRKIIQACKKADSPPFHVIEFPDRGYDIRRVPSNINAAYAYVEARGTHWDYCMISGDDSVYPPNYVEFLLAKLAQDTRLAIVSGDCGVPPPPNWIKAPQGAGRIVKENFWQRIGGRYPLAYGWESWVLFKALELGYGIANFTELRYVHLRPSGSVHRFSYWGAAMRTLGFHPFLVFLRVAENLIQRAEPISLQGNLTMLVDYLLPIRFRRDPYFQYFDDDFRRFVRRQQLVRVQRHPKTRRFRGFVYAIWSVFENLCKI
jgi:glycosyltransferase involved in cell wall biosynthesis